MTATLTLSFSLLDDHARQATPILPVLQSWTATVRQVTTVEILADDTTVVPVPDGATMLYSDLGDNLNLTLNGEPLCSPDTALAIPLVYPLGGQASVELGNQDTENDVSVEVIFV